MADESLPDLGSREAVRRWGRAKRLKDRGLLHALWLDATDNWPANSNNVPKDFSFDADMNRISAGVQNMRVRDLEKEQQDRRDKGKGKQPGPAPASSIDESTASSQSGASHSESVIAAQEAAKREQSKVKAAKKKADEAKAFAAEEQARKESADKAKRRAEQDKKHEAAKKKAAADKVLAERVEEKKIEDARLKAKQDKLDTAAAQREEKQKQKLNDANRQKAFEMKSMAAQARTAATKNLAAEDLAAKNLADEQKRKLREDVWRLAAEGRKDADAYNASMTRLEAERRERERRGGVGESSMHEREQNDDQYSASPDPESTPKASTPAQQHLDTPSSGGKRKASERREMDKLGAPPHHERPSSSQASGSPQRPKKRSATSNLPATTEALGGDQDTEMFDAPVTDPEQPLITARGAAGLEAASHTTVHTSHVFQSQPTAEVTASNAILPAITRVAQKDDAQASDLLVDIPASKAPSQESFLVVIRNNKLTTTDGIFLDAISGMVEHMHHQMTLLATGTASPQVSLADILQQLLGHGPISDPFLDNASPDAKLDFVRTFKAETAIGALREAWIESYYADIFEPGNETSAGSSDAREGQIRLDQLCRIVQPKAVAPGSRNEWARYWRLLRELRRQGCHHFLLFKTPTMSSLLRTKSAAHRFRIADVQDWNYVLGGLCRQFFARAQSELTGDFRGLADIPDDIRTASVEHHWSNLSGRWATSTDAWQYATSVALPDLRITFLDSEACYSYGYLGYPERNAMAWPMVLRIDGTLTCVTTTRINKGMVLGLLPTVTSYSPNDTQSTYIYARQRDVHYDHTKLLGTLSFLEFVDDRGAGNVTLAADIYHDRLYPHLVSHRVLVISSRTIKPFSRLRVEIPKASKPSATELNEAIREVVANLEREPQTTEESLAVRLDLISQTLFRSTSEANHKTLEQTCLTPYLTRAAEAFVPVTPQHHRILLDWKQKHAQASDYSTWGVVSAFKSDFDTFRKLAKNVKARFVPDLSKIDLLTFYMIATKAVGLPYRRGKKISNQLHDLEADGRSHLLRPLPPPLAPLGIDLPIGSLHLAAALQFICTIKPLAKLFVSDAWIHRFKEPQWLEQDDESYISLFNNLAIVLKSLFNKKSGSCVPRADVLDLQTAIRETFAIDMTTPQDPHEIFMIVHTLLAEFICTSRPMAYTATAPPQPQVAHVTRGQTSTASADRITHEWRLVKEASRAPWLLGHTMGMFAEIYKCANGPCSDTAVPQLTQFAVMSQLTAPLPAKGKGPIDLRTVLRYSYGMNTLENHPVEPDNPEQLTACSNCGSETKFVRTCEITYLPEYLTIQLVRFVAVRSTGKSTELLKSNIEVRLPQDMVVDLAEFTSQRYVRHSSSTSYDIVSVIEHKGSSRLEGNIACLAIRDGRWYIFDGNMAVECSTGRIGANPADTYMLLLKRRTLGQPS
ncbi:Ubiquitin carboxyl-terminal hydrolase 48 [Recurvomyces mirabilis]|nr:Ubiquitin carboxyl-terminal hydrolase 48 [Recurvomyces mirabilis]